MFKVRQIGVQERTPWNCPPPHTLLAKCGTFALSGPVFGIVRVEYSEPFRIVKSQGGFALRCLLSVLILLTSSQCLISAENPLSGSEEAFVNQAVKAFEKNDYVTVESSLDKFRLLIGSRAIPDDVELTVSDLQFRTLLAQVQKKFWMNMPPAIADDELARELLKIDDVTQRVVGVLTKQVKKFEEMKADTAILMSVARIQRIYLDRAIALRTMKRYEKAVLELDQVDQYRKNYEEHSEDPIHIETVTPRGIERLPSTRGQSVGFYGRQVVLEERIYTYKHWKMDDPMLAEPKEKLIDYLHEFTETWPEHGSSFNYAYDMMQLNGKFDMSQWNSIMEASKDKTTTVYQSNRISLANQHFFEARYPEAKKIYESVLKSGRCPPNRLAEVYMLLGDICSADHQHEEANKYYKLSKSHGDQFKHVDSMIASNETQIPIKPIPSPWWRFPFVLLNVVGIAVGAILLIRRTQRSPRTE